MRYLSVAVNYTPGDMITPRPPVNHVRPMLRNIRLIFFSVPPLLSPISDS